MPQQVADFIHAFGVIGTRRMRTKTTDRFEPPHLAVNIKKRKYKIAQFFCWIYIMCIETFTIL